MYSNKARYLYWLKLSNFYILLQIDSVVSESKMRSQKSTFWAPGATVHLNKLKNKSQQELYKD